MIIECSIGQLMMNSIIKKYLLPFFCLMVLVGCASTMQTRGVPYHKQIKFFPPLEQEITQSLGQTLVSKTILNVADGVEILKQIRWEVGGGAFTIPRQRARVLGRSVVDGSEIFLLKFTVEGTNMIHVDLRSTPEKSYYLWKSVRGRTMTVDPLIIKEVDDIEIGEVPLLFEQELIYNGRVGDNLRFVYREFNNKMARSAFSQEIQYDLSESNIIGFKEVRIEIIEATNSNITYKVIVPFL